MNLDLLLLPAGIEPCQFSNSTSKVAGSQMDVTDSMLHFISPYSVRMRESTDQKNSEYEPFLCSEGLQSLFFLVHCSNIFHQTALIIFGYLQCRSFYLPSFNVCYNSENENMAFISTFISIPFSESTTI